MPARWVLISVIRMLSCGAGAVCFCPPGPGARHCALAVGHRLSLRATHFLDFPGADCVRLGAAASIGFSFAPPLRRFRSSLPLIRVEVDTFFSAMIRRAWSHRRADYRLACAADCRSLPAEK